MCNKTRKTKYSKLFSGDKKRICKCEDWTKEYYYETWVWFTDGSWFDFRWRIARFTVDQILSGIDMSYWITMANISKHIVISACYKWFLRSPKCFGGAYSCCFVCPSIKRDWFSDDDFIFSHHSSFYCCINFICHKIQV